MSKTVLVLPDSHAHPKHNNERASWVGKLMLDLKPDIFVNIGDQWDMQSLSSYDKGKRDFQGRTYADDIASGLDFSERLFAPLRGQKRKLPRSIYLIGNHEQRIDRALDLSPELEGTISYADLDLKRDYDTIVNYSGQTPGSIEIEGIQFAHFFISGIMGRPIGGMHPAYSCISTKYQSCVAGHSHTFDYAVRSNGNGKLIQGLVSGCYVDYQPSWAGEVTKMWVPGVSILRGVEDGQFDFQWVSLKELKKEFGNGP